VPQEAVVIAAPATYRASVLLAVRNQAGLMLRCLESVARLGDDAGFEAVVIDDGSSDETGAILAGVDGDFQGLSSAAVGWGLAVDRAAAAARGEHLIVMREDVVPVDGWFDALIAALDADPGAGAVRPRTAALDGSVLGGEDWACLAVRRAAFAAVGGFGGASEYGRPERDTFLPALRAAGWSVADAPAATVLLVPEGAGA
jgi:glycosyltransferase involved in cell wall biosynthesis